MKIRLVISLALVALLLVSSVALAQTGRPPALPGYMVKQETISGGGYTLTSMAWQALGVASGGGYRLMGPLSLSGTGTPCCCSHLPSVHRSY